MRSMATMTADAQASRGRLLAVIVVLAILLAVGTLTAAVMLSTRASKGAGEPMIGGSFTLTTQDGDKLTDADLKGTPFAVFFGFTHCPEICPTTLWEMSEALKQLGPDTRLRVLFISVDPTRDTAPFLAKYLQSFDSRIVGLTGTEAEIADVGKKYRAFWEKVPLEDGDYTMNHTASVFLMDAGGRFVGVIGYGEEMGSRMSKLRRLIDSTATT